MLAQHPDTLIEVTVLDRAPYTDRRSSNLDPHRRIHSKYGASRAGPTMAFRAACLSFNTRLTSSASTAIAFRR